MDIAKLNLGGPWCKLLRAWSKGEDIDGLQVRKLLESGDAVPQEANQMLAEIISGSANLRRGNRPMYERNFLTSPRFVVGLVRRIEECIKDPSKLPEDADDETREWYQSLHHRSKLKRAKTKISPNQVAVAHTAKQLGISERHVRSKIREYRKEVERQLK